MPEKIAHHTRRRIWRKLRNCGAFAFVHFEPVSNAIFFDCFWWNAFFTKTKTPIIRSYRTCSSRKGLWRHLPSQLEVVFKLRKEAIRFKRSVHSCGVHEWTLRMWQHFCIQPFTTQHPHVVDDVKMTCDIFKSWRKRFVLQYILWIIRSTYITKTKRKVMLEMCEISQSLNS